MKKILKIKWENILLIIMLCICGLSLHVTINYYLSQWEMWLVVIIAHLGTICGYILFKTVRKCLLEIIEE